MKVSVINTFVRISGFQSIQETEFKQSIIRHASLESSELVRDFQKFAFLSDGKFTVEQR